MPPSESRALPLQSRGLRLRGSGDHQPEPPPLRLDPDLPTSGESGFSLLTLNMKGSAFSEKQAAGLEPWDYRMRALFSTLHLWHRPALVALQELGGGQASLDRAAIELSRLGYDSAARAGEEAVSRKDGHRRGGVLLAWQRQQFRPASSTQIGTSEERNAKAFALLHASDVEEAHSDARISAATASELQKFTGRRAIAVRLIRTRGPQANEELLFATVYVPASANHTVRAAFIELVANKVQSIVLDPLSDATLLPFVVAGDWNASPGPDSRRNGTPNDVHDDALLEWWFGGSDRAAFCAPISWGLKKGDFTFRSSISPLQDRHLDFVFTDTDNFPRWRASQQGGIFLGEWGGDSEAFDHRVGLFFRDEGTLESLGEGRGVTFRISTSPKCWPLYSRLAAQFVAPLGATADESLAALELFLIQCASTAMGADRWSNRAPRPLPPDEPEIQLKWLQGLYGAVSASFEWTAVHDARAHELFTDTSNDRLYKAVILRRVRDREIKRAVLRGRVLSWQDLRNACAKRLRDAIAKLQPEVELKRRRLRQAIDLGVGEPCSAQEFAERTNERLRIIRQRDRASKFQLSALTGADGEIERKASAVHEIAHRYGVLQNRLSKSDDEAFGVWLESLVPQAPTLTLPSGAPWSLRAALPVEVLRREARKQRKGKARALSPFIIEMIQCLPDGHPAELAYFELLLRCMEDGVYPANFLQIIAVLLPKKAAGLLAMATLRDIWLINHGAKFAERCLLHTALTPIGARVLSNHAGGCRGRGCTEQAFALHLCIDDALARRKPLYVLYVDLTKCFMSFSRSAGAQAMRHYGLPEPALRALQGLVDNWKHGVAQGRYETAFGSTEPFPILRGFLQGAQGSPEACKIMMDTLAQALELKVSGYSAFAPDGAGGEMGSLVFVDDAANATDEAFFLHRVTVFWSIWSRITDCQLNIKGKSKTVVQALEYKRARDGTLTPSETCQKFYIAGVTSEDPPRLIPSLLVRELYLYCGMATRMDGRHNDDGLSTLRTKLASCAGRATSSPISRRLALACAGLGIYGNAFFYGTCFGGSFESIEERLGSTCRRVVQAKAVKGPRRSYSAPRIQLHASPNGVATSANDDLTHLFVAAAGPAAFASGYGNAHVWPAMMAAGLMTLVNALASPVRTPAADRAHHALARVLWTYGLRQLDYGPKGIFLGAVFEHLRMDNILERPLWLLFKLGAGYLPLVDVHFDEWSPLCPWRWPGYPDDWVALWHGPLYAQLRAKGVTFCHTLATAGVAELANLCDEEQGGFLDADSVLANHPRALELGAAQARRELRALMGAIQACSVAPVPGRRGWAMADAADGKIPPYAPPELGLFRQLGLADRATCKRSGDGGERLTSLLDVSTAPPSLRELFKMMPQDSTRISYTNSISGVAINTAIPSSGLQNFVRSLSQQAPSLVPALFRIVSTSAYLQNPGVFWTSCLHAKEIALLMLGDPSCQPSADELDLLNVLRTQGVDWLAWLSAQPDNDRNGAQVLDESEAEEGENLNATAEARANNLIERRDLLRADSDAVRRVTQSLQLQPDHGEHRDAIHRFLQWLEDDSGTSPPLNGNDASNSTGRQPEPPLSDASAAPPTAAQAGFHTPPDLPWQREPLLECDMAWSSLSPALLERERARPPLLTDEACRLIRSTDSFGVLLIGLGPQAPPTDTAVHRAFVEAKSRLHAAQMKSERGVTVRHPRWQAARQRLNDAWLELRNPKTRLKAWCSWVSERKGPITTSLTCVLHEAPLRTLLASPAAASPGHSPGVTIGDEIAGLLNASEAHPNNPLLRALHVEYRHSEKGARLVAAGFVRFSREYAVGPDPFKCSKAVRLAAFGEVSHDLDDAVSFPTAQQAIFPTSLVDRGCVIHMSNSATLIAHPAEVRAAVGRHFLREDLLGSAEAYARAKVLLSAIENGASCEAWLLRQPAHEVRSRAVSVDLSIAPSSRFNPGRFAREQDARARWLAFTRPDLIRYVGLLNSLMGEGDKDDALTAKSYILQDYEGASRQAKVEWARRSQAEVISLQHDGVRMRIPRNLEPDAVARHLSDFCSQTLGYRQSVVIKSSPTGAALLDRVTPSTTPPAVPQHNPTRFTPGVTVHDSGRRRNLKGAFSALLGSTRPAPCSPPGCVGPTQIDLDGATRRTIFYYDSKLQPDARAWHQRVQGGFHQEWTGRGDAWLHRVRLAYRIDSRGRLLGNPTHADCPLAARFWWECQLICDKARKSINATECAFVFNKLLILESEYPVSHFVATDGSRDTDDETGATRVSRACVAVQAGALGHLTLGGQLDVFADTFERHSYEAELAAFHDHLAATSGSVTVVVTDCLSGMQAGHAFPGRTASSRSARYRDKELGNIHELEQRHRALLYVHVHSHVGITPNEAADVTAAFMLRAPIVPLDLMPPAHAKCRIAGVKRGIGRAAFDFCTAFMTAKLASASSFTLLETSDTWPLLQRRPVKARILTEATYDSILDARADRSGLLADRLGDGLRERVLTNDGQQLERARSYRPQKGSWAWWCQVHAPCPCTGCFQARDVVVSGLWRPAPARAPQTRWHTLTECSLGDAPALRERASGWLSQRLSDFGTQQAHYALAALSGAARRLDPRQQHAALRFMLGLPDTPTSQAVTESPETARTLALGYGRGFLKWIAAILRTGHSAACTAQLGPRPKANAVRTTVVSYRHREVVIERPAPRSTWTASRGLREVWDGACTVRRAFRALRLWATMAGPSVLQRPKRVLGVPTTEPDKEGGRDVGEWAYDQWAADINVVTAFYTLADHARSNSTQWEIQRTLAFVGKQRRRLVWLRDAGFDPIPQRRKQERIEAAKEAVLRAMLAKQARAAARVAQRERIRAAREAAADAAEAARLASAAVTRPLRSTVEATLAAIDADRRCNQASAFAPRIPTGGAVGAPEHVPFTCARGHFLVPAPVRGGAHSFRPRCNGPCGMLIRPGALRWMCEGHGCDIDICLECVGVDVRVDDSRARIRCPLGHSMQFRLTSTSLHLQRKCDGPCHKPLCSGAWAFGCEPCQLDLCAACAPEGISPEADPPLGRATAKRGRAQPVQARPRPAGKRAGAPQRGRRAKHRRTLFDSDDGSEDDDADAPRAPRNPHISVGETAAGSRAGGGPCQDEGERGDSPKKAPRQAYGEGPGRKRSGMPSIRSRGQGL